MRDQRFSLRDRDILTCLIARTTIQSVFNATNARDVQVLRRSDVILKSHIVTHFHRSIAGHPYFLTVSSLHL